MKTKKREKTQKTRTVKTKERERQVRANYSGMEVLIVVRGGGGGGYISLHRFFCICTKPVKDYLLFLVQLQDVGSIYTNQKEKKYVYCIDY